MRFYKCLKYSPVTLDSAPIRKGGMAMTKHPKPAAKEII